MSMSDLSVRMASIRYELGEVLFADAVSASRKFGPFLSRAESSRVVKASSSRKTLSLKRRIELVMEVGLERARGLNARVGWINGGWGFRRARPDLVLKAPTVERWEGMMKMAVVKAFDSAGYKTELSGKSSTRVVFAPKDYTGSLSEWPRVAGWTSRGDRYSRRCSYSRTDLSISLYVRRDWVERVGGMAVVDGLFNLDLERAAPDLWRAVWVEQGRAAADLRAVSGYIHKDPATGETAHGKTGRDARLALSRRAAARKALATREERERQVARALRVIEERLELGVANGESDIVVFFKDSIKAGNCEAGTRDWINRHFAGRESATVAEIIKVEDRRRFAVAACLQAVRRSGRAA